MTALPCRVVKSAFASPPLDDATPVAYNVVMGDTLGTFEHGVMLAIVRLGDEAYGRAILSEVQVRMRRDVAPGAVHATLDRLEKKRLLSSRLASGTPARGGRARRYYRLQPAGLKALNEARAAVDTLWQGLAWPLKISTGGGT